MRDEDEGSANEWDPVAEGWDDEPAVRIYAARAHEDLVRITGARGASIDDARVLDFGCGTGLLTERLVGHAEVIDAVDTSPAMLAVLDAKIREHGWTSVTTASSLNDGHVAYDLVVASSVLGFVDRLDETVADLSARLAPGGLLVHWDWERNAATDDPHGLDPDDVRRALASAGLVDVEVGPGFELTFEGETMRPILGVGGRA